MCTCIQCYQKGPLVTWTMAVDNHCPKPSFNFYSRLPVSWKYILKTLAMIFFPRDILVPLYFQGKIHMGNKCSFTKQLCKIVVRSHVACLV